MTAIQEIKMWNSREEYVSFGRRKKIHLSIIKFSVLLECCDFSYLFANEKVVENYISYQNGII